ncbi:hypothetical protein [Streptomyces sp. NPDC047525]|uniref:hypothetical protein n=1 Tax=Streptomyces sp. NPDC047525 TaxID=3155264 RepID=UPI0033DEA9F5
MTAASVALSGSLSRGEARVTGRRVLSDLDLIPVVLTPEDAILARKQLASVLQELSVLYEITCTAAITLEANFLRARHAGYVTSMATQPFAWDPLDVTQRLKGRSGEPTSPADVLPWLVQPVTYYLAKAGALSPEENLAKAARATRHLLYKAGLSTVTELALVDRLGSPSSSDDVQRGVAEGCANAVRHIADSHNVQLLPSSQEFLARAGTSADTENAQETFRVVRDRTFLENQGLPFEVSAMAARPTV